MINETNVNTIKEVSIKVIENNIEQIKVSTKDLGQFIHKTAIDCMVHAFKNSNNFVPMTNLVKALDKSQRQTALRKWFIRFAPVIWDNTTNQFVKDSAKTEYQIYEAVKLPYFEAFKEAAPEFDISVEALAEKLFNNAERVMKEKDKGKVIPAETLALASLIIQNTEGYVMPSKRGKKATKAPAVDSTNVTSLPAMEKASQGDAESVAA